MTFIEIETDWATVAACHMGLHDWEMGHCLDCGHVNYRVLGWFGAVARWAKAWGVTKDEAAERIVRNQISKDIKAGMLEGAVEDYL